LIIIGSAIQVNVLPKVTFWNFLGPDKIAHLFAFGVFVVFSLYGLKKQFSYLHLQHHATVYTLVFGVLLALFTELMQRYIVFGRDGNVYDLLADIAGCLMGLAVFNIFLDKKLNSLQNKSYLS